MSPYPLRELEKHRSDGAFRAIVIFTVLLLFTSALLALVSWKSRRLPTATEIAVLSGFLLANLGAVVYSVWLYCCWVALDERSFFTYAPGFGIRALPWSEVQKVWSDDSSKRVVLEGSDRLRCLYLSFSIKAFEKLNREIRERVSPGALAITEVPREFTLDRLYASCQILTIAFGLGMAAFCWNDRPKGVLLGGFVTIGMTILMMITPRRVILRSQGILVAFPLCERQLGYGDIREVVTSVEESDGTNIVVIKMTDGRTYQLKNFSGGFEQFERAIRVSIAAAGRSTT